MLKLFVLAQVSLPSPDFGMFGAGATVRRIVAVLLGFALTFFVGSIIIGAIGSAAGRDSGGYGMSAGASRWAVRSAVAAVGCGASAFLINLFFGLGQGIGGGGA